MLEYTYEHAKIKVIKWVFEPEQITTTRDSSLSEDLLQFNKEFAAFNDFYACFCDALASEVVENEVMDAGTVEGINRCSRWMKHRMEEFRVRLEVMQDTGSGPV